MASKYACTRSYRRLIARFSFALFVILIVALFSRWPPSANAYPSSGGTDRPTQLSVDAELPSDHAHLARSHDQQQIIEEKTRPAENTPTKLASASAQPSHFDLEQMRSVMPGDYEREALLSPLDKTGEPLLRDLAHRTRAFRTVYEAWKDLHLIDTVTALSHMDLLSRLRTVSPSSTPTAESVHTYDALGHFVHSFARLLFPWTMLAYPDHMALHASFYFGGRGLVFTAGDHQGPLLLTTIPSLRSLGCQLPIKVFYLGDSDLSKESRLELEKLPGVVMRDLTMMIDDDGWKLAGMESSSVLQPCREVTKQCT